MITLGMKVMVRDPYIKEDYHVPPAEVVRIKNCPVLLTKEYLLEFSNGKKEWFDHWAVKTE